MLTDPISDFLTRIRNAQRANHSNVSVPNSKMKAAICEVLKKQEYIQSYEIKDRNIEIVFDENKMNLNLKRVSRPGQRIYADHKNIPKVLNGIGTSILSTSHGLMTGDEAKKKNLGGELICEIY